MVRYRTLGQQEHQLNNKSNHYYRLLQDSWFYEFLRLEGGRRPTGNLKNSSRRNNRGAFSEKHMQAYLDEYVFRFNRRKAAQRGLLFYRLLECAMCIPPITYGELVENDDF